MLDQVPQTMVTGETQSRNTPPRDVAKTQRAASGYDASQRRPAGVCGAQNAPDTCPRNARNRDVVLLEDLQNTQMRETPRKPATQG
jgi:hypothetical protein